MSFAILIGATKTILPLDLCHYYGGYFDSKRRVQLCLSCLEFGGVEVELAHGASEKRKEWGPSTA